MSDIEQGRRFLRRPDVRAKTGLPDSTMYYLIGQGRFPRPVKLSPKLAAWIEQEIDAWMDARIAERDKSAA